MKLIIDTEAATVVAEDGKDRREMPMASAEAFQAVSDAWLRAGWDAKYVYSFTWLGRPIIQLPEDMIRLQEVIYRLKPDVIVETGVAHGGGLIFYASLCRLIGKGRVIGIDIEIRPHNRQAIEAHPLADLITLVSGDSTAADTVAQVRDGIEPNDRVLVLLDANHTKAHVLAELDAYAPLVSVGSYIVAMDGIMEKVAGGPRTKPEWRDDNPRRAALEWAQLHPEFIIEEPEFAFNEGLVTERVTYWPDAFLRRVTPVSSR
jgi:cephalosporin hydroxylase